MGIRGAKPKPTAMKILAGNPGHRPLPKREPKPELGAPTCPAWLDVPAKVAWRQLTPQLVKMGVLTKIDRNALARYCTLWARWKEAEIFIAKNGSVYPVKHSDGTLKSMQRFPQVGIAEKLAAQLLRLEQEFGLTPSARVRIEVPDGAFEDDGMGKFIPKVVG